MMQHVYKTTDMSDLFGFLIRMIERYSGFCHLYYLLARFLLHLPVFPQTQSDGHSSLVLCVGQFTAGFADFGCADLGLEATFLVLFGEARPAKAAFCVATSRCSASTLAIACFNSASTRESSFIASSRWSCFIPV